MVMRFTRVAAVCDHGVVRWCVLLLSGLLLGATSAGAAERLIRTFGTDQALPVQFIKTLVQDPAGFLWIGTSAGLVRYDGREMIRWGTDLHDQEVPSLAASADGTVVCTSWDGRVFQVTASGLELLAPPGGFGSKARQVVFDEEGALVVATQAGLHRRTGDGSWAVLPSPEPEAVTLILGGDGPLFAATYDRAWRWNGGSWDPLGEVGGRPVDATRTPDGGVLLLTGDGSFIPFGDVAGERTPRSRAGRGIGIAVRRGTVWVAADRHLTAYRPGEPPEVLDNRHGIWSGGPLLIDREGSLWLGTNAGLHHFPEPDTRAYSDLDGLPSAHVRFIAESEGRIYTSHWQGMGWLDGPIVRTLAGPKVNSRICTDGRGRVWGMGFTENDRSWWVAVSRAAVETWELTPRTTWVVGCATSARGTVWLTDEEGIYETADDGPPVRRADRPAGFGNHIVDQIVVLRAGGGMVVTAGPIACEAREDAVRAGTPTWRCTELIDQRSFGGLEEASDGALWAVAVPGGVFRETSDGWERLEATDTLPSQWLSGLSRSPRGGLWLLGHGIFLRVADDGRPGAHFDVLERLGKWEGLVGQAPKDVLEAADGTVWAASEMGLNRIPRTVARSELPVPDTHLVSARVDGRTVDGAVEAEVPPGAVVDLRFSALSYRDPGKVQYRFRSGPDKPWSAPRPRPELLLVEPPAGTHIVEVVSSLDGERWSAQPARFVFHARPPWYRDVRVGLGLLGALLLLVGGAWQVRVQQLLRVERLRTRVAMDLHDEVGSGLGSIGLLAGTAGLVPDDVRDEILERIVDTSAELGRSLSAIVWSLKTDSNDLCSLAARLAERGAAMFPGGGPELVVELPPDLPERSMDVAVVRTVLLVGLEAMHNAARHSGGTRVLLRVARAAGGRWQLVVEDNGRGIEARSDADGGGYGLEGMRRRAAEVGAELVISASEEGGTRIELTF
jgi:ligand-binding sensor domain-containing protein/two-component sensor histidine kinase